MKNIFEMKDYSKGKYSIKDLILARLRDQGNIDINSHESKA